MTANGVNGNNLRKEQTAQYDFRQHLPDLSTPRFTTMAKQDAHEYAKGFLEGGQPYWLFALYKHWRRLFQEPYKGVTTDGHVRPDLFPIQDEGIDIEPIVASATAFLDACSPEQRTRVLHHVDSPEWRSWSNPEFLISNKGERLDEVSEKLRSRALDLLRASTSPEGYAKAVGAMRTNGFLGRLVGAPAVMNEHSYNVVVFGAPSATRPWGWAVYGHHLCLNFFFYRRQMVLSPWFTGAEPNAIDDGEHVGTRILQEEERLGLKLMQGLPPDLQRAARVYDQMHDPAMPPGRWNRDDQRHLCGAYRDNRVIPYEGIRVADMPVEGGLREFVWEVCRQYLLYLPTPAREAKMRSVMEFVDETYFCWIGGFGDDDPFYYRIQSPVIIVEFDHHSGVFLTNEHPAKFHIHTILRTPNAGDYGMALRSQIPPAEDFFEAVL